MLDYNKLFDDGKKQLEKLRELKQLKELKELKAIKEPKQLKALRQEKPLYFRAACGVIVLLLAIVILLPDSSVPAGDDAKPMYVQIKPGMTAGEIGELLQEKGVIMSKYRFWFVAKLNGADSSFKTGNYVFQPHMETRDVLQQLVQGSSLVLRFTIPEGYNVNEIAKALAEKGIVNQKDFLREAKSFAPYDYMTGDSREAYRAEGFLFPDTYEIRSDAGAADVLKLMAGEFDQKLTPELRERAAEQGLSVYELITLASLVEKEARFEEDRPMIAQVFLKRLRIGMPLQSDTTIQYLLNAPKEDVSIEDTKIDSPYNTYQHMGLPPGPIANPGIASIRAVLWPADTDYLYFVADREGHNHYSQSYEEHLAIVEQVR